MSIHKNILPHLLFAVLAFSLCVSCGGPGVRTESFNSGGMDGLASPDAKDDVDTACSYYYFLWGRYAELNGHDDEAQEAYEKSIVCDDQAEYVVRRLAALLLKMGKKKQAIQWMEKMIASRPDETKPKIFLADLYASLAYDRGRSADAVNKAVAIYKKILVKEPKNNAVMLKLGKLYLHNLEYSRARTVLERLVSDAPESFGGLYFLARLYRELGYMHKSAKRYEQALAVHWSVPLAMEIAEFYEDQKEDRHAARIYQKILVENNEDEVVIGRLVRIYLNNHEADKALSLLRRLRNKTTDSLKINFTIGRIYLEQKNYVKAINLFKNMQISHPEVAEIRSLLALSYFESGDNLQAKKILLNTKSDAQGYDDAILLLVKIYADEKDYPAAVNLLRGAISKTKGDEQLNFYFGLAALYEEEHKQDTAEDVFITAISNFADSAKAHLRYSMFLDRIGQQDKALAQMEKVIVLEPDNIMALNYVGYTWADRGVKLDLALKYIKQAVEGRPDDGFIRDSLGWVYFRLGELKQAVVEFKKALSDEPDDPTIHEHLADVYNAMQKKRLALEHYRQALQLSEKKDVQGRLRSKIKALEGTLTSEFGIQNGD